MGQLAQAVKDRILVETFAGPIFIGLARGKSIDHIEEEIDAAYKRMAVRFAPPDGRGLRFIANADPIIFPGYSADAIAPVEFGILSHDQAGGSIIWTERLERARQLQRGDMFIFAPGEIRVGLP